MTFSVTFIVVHNDEEKLMLLVKFDMSHKVKTTKKIHVIKMPYTLVSISEKSISVPNLHPDFLNRTKKF